MLFSEQLLGALECLLFVAHEPLSEKELAQLMELKESEVKELLEVLIQEYEGKSKGIQVLGVGGGYQFSTRPEYFSYVERLYKPQTQSLSRAALETLAIIAYKQPITRAEVEQIRGVKVDSVVNTLMEKRLLQEVGRKEGPGRPILYGTSDKFLQYFGLKELEELPDPKQFITDNSAEDAAATKEGAE